MTESASATIIATEIAADDFRYDVTLIDTGTTPLGTFWFAWVPGKNFLDTEPTSVAAPTGWTDSVTHAGTGDGYAIQWHVVSTSADEVASGASLSGFSFTSADTPAEVFGNSTHYPATSVLTSVVYSGEPFSDGGAQFEVSAACFRAGTRIATARGEIAVEDLCVGDLVAAPRGDRLAPVRWLGHRHVDCRRHRQPANVWPVRVAAGAFAPGVPHTALFLSPDHAVFVDGALIPIRYLANGRTIAQQAVDAVTYWHVELDRHDILLAEGLACESYLETGNRAAFANGGTTTRLHPDFSRHVWDGEGCAPLLLEGAGLAAVRRRLSARAAALARRSGRPPEVEASPARPVALGSAALRTRSSAG